MKKDYSFGKTEVHSPVGSKPPKRGPIKGRHKKKAEFHFEGLEDTPPKVTYRANANGFRIQTPARNYGKAAGTLIPIIIAGFVGIYGPDAEKTDPFLPRLVCGIIAGLFFLGGIYQLLRKHEFEIKGDSFRLSEGLGLLRFSRKGKVSDIKSAWVDNKIRSGNTADIDLMDEGQGSSNDPTRNRFYFLAVRLKDKTILHTLEGSPEVTLHYILYALRGEVMKKK